MQQDTLVLALLKDYIIVSRLNNGLSATGLNTEEFNIGLAGTIFQLMGFGHDDLSDERFNRLLSKNYRIPCLQLAGRSRTAGAGGVCPHAYLEVTTYFNCLVRQRWPPNIQEIIICMLYVKGYSQRPGLCASGKSEFPPAGSRCL
jgi:hypothetical protein